MKKSADRHEDCEKQVLSQSFDDLEITRGECLERTRWSSPLDLTTYLYYFTSGCAPITTWSHVLPEHSMITWPCYVIWSLNLPMLFISWLCYMTWCWRLNVQMRGKLFPFQGSHNMALPSRFLVLRNFSIVSNSCPISSLSPFHISFCSTHIVILP